MAKNINIIYLGFRDLNRYLLCEYKDHETNHLDPKFKGVEDLISYLSKSFKEKYRNRKIEFNLDSEIPREEKEKLLFFIKTNFPRRGNIVIKKY